MEKRRIYRTEVKVRRCNLKFSHYYINHLVLLLFFLKKKKLGLVTITHSQNNYYNKGKF